MTQYADDTTAFLTGNDVVLTLNRIQDDLQLNHWWLQGNRLTLNNSYSNCPQSVQTCPL